MFILINLYFLFKGEFMFKCFILSALVVLGFQSVQARSLMPRCAPSIDAQPSRLNCVKEMNVTQVGGKQEVSRVFYTIVINTKMSPASCMDEGHFVEVRRADVSVSTNENGQLASIQLKNGTFEYQLGGVQRGSFKADVIGLDLKDCVSPLHGGFSLGN
jgi:hypothetical protein